MSENRSTHYGSLVRCGLICTAIVVAAILIRNGLLTPVSQQEQWEYKTHKGVIDEDELNLLGEEGWSLIAIRPVTEFTTFPVFYFKRLKNPPEESDVPETSFFFFWKKDRTRDTRPPDR
jgi:hypothetical protein